MQLFKKTARKSGYERHSFIKEFKRELNGTIRRRLAKVKTFLTMIEQ